MRRVLCWLGFHSITFTDLANAIRCLADKRHVRWCRHCKRDVYGKPFGWQKTEIEGDQP